MLLILAVLSIFTGCHSVRISKGINPINEIDSLPPTIIHPPVRTAPGIAADTTSWFNDDVENRVIFSRVDMSEKQIK